MRKIIFSLSTILFLTFTTNVWAQNIEIPATREGDIIFQSLAGGQNYAIYLVSGSPYTHCGLITEQDGEFYVYEAVGPVKLTPLKAWIERGVDQHYVLMRLKDAEALLTQEALTTMRESAATFAGKPYDFWFLWSDDNIYCSELVWKVYQKALDRELAPLRPFRDYDNVQHEEVMRIARERFNIPEIPWDEPAVTPADVLVSPLLETGAANAKSC